MADDCIFCKIVNKTLPAEILYEDDDVVAFSDIHPQAPTHFLVIPKKHIPTLDDIGKEDRSVVGQMLVVAADLSRKKGIAERGYRQIINCREFGGQLVFHLHLHILGGRQLGKMG